MNFYLKPQSSQCFSSDWNISWEYYLAQKTEKRFMNADYQQIRMFPGDWFTHCKPFQQYITYLKVALG